MSGGIDGVAAMAKVSGLSRDEVLGIWEDVKANHARLDGCAWHEFEPSGAAATPMRQKYRCRHCGGVIDRQAYRWHEIGRRPRPTS